MQQAKFTIIFREPSGTWIQATFSYKGGKKEEEKKN